MNTPGAAIVYGGKGGNSVVYIPCVVRYVCTKAFETLYVVFFGGGWLVVRVVWSLFWWVFWLGVGRPIALRVVPTGGCAAFFLCG